MWQKVENAPNLSVVKMNYTSNFFVWRFSEEEQTLQRLWELLGPRLVQKEEEKQSILAITAITHHVRLS